MRKSKFWGIFPKSKKEKEDRYSEFLEKDDISIEVVSDKTISESGYDTICDIVTSVMKEEDIYNYGNEIAKRIVEAEIYPGLCACRADGGIDGSFWIIVLSTNLLDFLN